MNRRSLQGLAALALSAVLSWPVVGQERYLYRYENAAGVTVIAHSVPAEYVDQGYDVITRSGRLVERVAAKAPEEEGGQSLSPAQQAEREREDAFILRSYSTVADVERAKERRLSQLSREIEMLEENIAGYQERREQYQQRAANYQRSGRKPPKVIDEVLVELNSQERQAMEVLRERRQEYGELERKYDRYAERLVALKGEAAEAGDGADDATSGTSPESAPATAPPKRPSAND